MSDHDQTVTIGYARIRRKTAFPWAMAVLLAVAQCALLSVAFLAMCVKGLSRFDTGGKPDLVELVVTAAFWVLGFPLMELRWYIHPIPREPEGWLPFLYIFNSLLWGVGIAWIVWRVRRRSPS